MAENVKNGGKNGVLKTAMLAVCSFVGVGFLTGAEIWFYFARFGLGLYVSLAVFAVLAVLLMWVAMRELGHENSPQNLKLRRWGMCAGELLVASAMISGLLQVSKTLFGEWWFISFLFAVFVIIIILFKGFKSFEIYNYFIAIFVIFVVLFLFLFNNNSFCEIEPCFEENVGLKSGIFGAIYIFMNISEIRPILEKFSYKNNFKKKVGLIFAILSILIFLVIVLSLVLTNNQRLSKSDMPFLSLFREKNGVVLWVFLVGLVMSMVSTANACLVGVVNKLNYAKKDEIFTKMIVIILILILGQIPFSVFVKIVYPFIGFMNVFLLVFELVEIKKGKMKKTSRVVG